MFVCGYHFPASEGNDVAFEKVVEKVTEGAGDVSGKTVTLTGETANGEVVVNLTIPSGTFAHTAFVDFYNKSEAAGDFKMVYFTNKYQISEVSKAIDGDATKNICKHLDDMNLYRVKVA